MDYPQVKDKRSERVIFLSHCCLNHVDFPVPGGIIDFFARRVANGDSFT